MAGRKAMNLWNRSSQWTIIMYFLLSVKSWNKIKPWVFVFRINKQLNTGGQTLLEQNNKDLNLLRLLISGKPAWIPVYKTNTRFVLPLFALSSVTLFLWELWRRGYDGVAIHLIQQLLGWRNVMERCVPALQTTVKLLF